MTEFDGRRRGHGLFAQLTPATIVKPGADPQDGLGEWMAGNTSVATGMKRFQLQAVRSSFPASFSDDNFYADVDGWLGKTVLRSRNKRVQAAIGAPL